MKIGIVHVGWTSTGTAQIVSTLMEGLSSQENIVYGIVYNRASKDLELKELTRPETPLNFAINRYDLSSFPTEIWNENARAFEIKLSTLDKIILLGGSEVEKSHLTAEHIHVPVSIFNDVEGSQFTLGYDTALNSIVKNIESVRDTASSLSYGKVRVFNVQIPGQGGSVLLNNVALTVGAEVITEDNCETIEHIKQHIREKESNKEGYTFLLMDSIVDPLKLEAHFGEFDLDWKIVEIDESQCGGPYPTAMDQLITNQYKKAVVEWVLSDQPSCQLLIQDTQVLYKGKEVKAAII